MNNKAKLAFEQLELEMEVLCIDDIRKVIGGTDPNVGDTWNIGGITYVWNGYAWEGNLPGVTINQDGGGNWYWTNPFGGFGGSWQSSSGYVGGGVGPGTGGTTPPTGNENNSPSGLDIAAYAIQTGLGFDEYYTTLDAARLGKVSFTAKEILHNLLSSNPGSDLIDDVKAIGQLKGIAFLSAAGRVIGITQSINSVYNLSVDIANDDGYIDPKNVADAVVSVGSLFIKSNILGVVVSSGWMLIKGQME